MPSFLIHVPGLLTGMVHSQNLSLARLIFLISLVVFFTVLFVVAYVWMRKPDFGQQGSLRQRTVSRRTPAPDEQPRVDTDSDSGNVVPPSISTVEGLPLEDGSKAAPALSVS